MKNTIKAFGIITLVAVIGFFFTTLSLTGCGGDDGGDDGDGNTVGGGNQPGKPDATFTSIDDMDAWLKDKPYNTAKKPYIIALNVDTVGGSPSYTGSIGSILKRYYFFANPEYSKYVYLDLSGSTFTDVNVEAFSSLHNLTGIILPNTVSIIWDKAFSNCDNLSSVTIPDGVTTIGESANSNVVGGVFSHCTSLVSITIPSSVTRIGGYDQFGYCTSLTAINVDPANTAFSSVGGVLYNKDQTILRSYPAGKTAASFTIPNGITTIWAYAFSGCTSITSVTIPNSVTSIMNRAFADCTSITSVTIPNSVTSIGSDLFFYCTSLTTINVDAANTAFSSVGGVLYNKDQTILHSYPPGKTGAFTIPNNVTSIREWSFYCCNSLTSVTIPSSVTSIGMGAFLYCRNLTSVTFQGAITSGNFSSSAFTGDLSTKYVGIGTYTTTAPVTSSSTVVWTKS